MIDISQGCEDIKICHVKICQSLYAHFDDFRDFFINTDFRVICMSETWLRSEITDEVVRLPGYTLIRCDRVGRVGGGMAFSLSDRLRASVLSRSLGVQAARPEYMIAEVSFKNCSNCYY